MVQAQAISSDNHAAQYVNRRLDGSFYTSDWYNCDSTLVCYSNGMRTGEYTEYVCMGTLDDHRCEIDYHHEAHYVNPREENDVPLMLNTSKEYVEIAISRTYEDKDDALRDKLYTD